MNDFLRLGLQLLVIMTIINIPLQLVLLRKEFNMYTSLQNKINNFKNSKMIHHDVTYETKENLVNRINDLREKYTYAEVSTPVAFREAFTTSLSKKFYGMNFVDRMQYLGALEKSDDVANLSNHQRVSHDVSRRVNLAQLHLQKCVIDAAHVVNDNYEKELIAKNPADTFNIKDVHETADEWYTNKQSDDFLETVKLQDAHNLSDTHMFKLLPSIRETLD